jgi:hypothetical protein
VLRLRAADACRYSQLPSDGPTALRSKFVDGDEARATSDHAGGSHVAGGGRGQGPEPPTVSAPSDAVATPKLTS